MTTIAVPLKVTRAVAYKLHDAEHASTILLSAWRYADRFAVRLRFLKAQESLGKKKLAVVVRALRDFPDLAQRATEFYSARMDPEESEGLFAVGSTAGAAHILESSDSAFWRVGPWEDLILFRGSDLVYWCLSHEKMAYLFGEENWLRQHAVGEIVTLRPQEWSLLGKPMDAETVSALRSMLANPT
ncbi:MAG TPA: hypothetical protein VJU61_27670 [Polyangiaceae bacterium]|nr:hypothetical protein [Polyangiaceae bacterium]